MKLDSKLLTGCFDYGLFNKFTGMINRDFYKISLKTGKFVNVKAVK